MLRHLALATCLATPLLASCDQAVEADENYLIVVLDDVGPEKVGAYGHRHAPNTPVMDGLAAEGVTFTNAYANPVCTPGRAALLTGRHGRRYSIGRVLHEDDPGSVPKSELFIPEVLGKGAHYASALVGKYHLAGGASLFRLRHPAKAAGFDHYAGSFGNLIALDRTDSEGDYYHWQKVTDGSSEMVEHYAVTETVDDAIAQMQTLPEPFVLVVSLQAAHHPWDHPPEELLNTPLPENPENPDVYDAIVEAADTEIGRLLSSMSIDQQRTTTIVLTADNGTAEAGARYPLTPETVKGTMYEGGLRVPMIVAGPTVVEPGRTSDQLVHLVDVLPTLAELSGIDLGRWEAKGHIFDGYSLAPVLEDPEATTGREVVFSEVFRDGVKDERVLRDDRYKLIRRRGEDDELYDLEGRYQEGPDLLLGKGDPSELGLDELTAYRALSDQLEAMTAEMIAD